MSEAKAYSREELEDVRKYYIPAMMDTSPAPVRMEVARLLATIDAQAEAIRVMAEDLAAERAHEKITTCADGYTTTTDWQWAVKGKWKALVKTRAATNDNAIASAAIREAEKKQ